MSETPRPRALPWGEHDKTIGWLAAGLEAFLAERGVCDSHGIDHACEVERTTHRALQCHVAPPGAPPLAEQDALAARVAALLHDADDRKFKQLAAPADSAASADSESTADAASKAGELKCPNARKLMADNGVDVATAELAVRLIGWVSASANGDAVPAEAEAHPEYLYPRLADRVAALGHRGVHRCWQYTISSGMPLYTDGTPRARTEEELWEIASPARYDAYRERGGVSASMVDHYYDKLLRVSCLKTDNWYLQGLVTSRQAPIVAAALAFGEGTERLGDVLAACEKHAEAEAASADLAWALAVLGGGHEGSGATTVGGQR